MPSLRLAVSVLPALLPLGLVLAGCGDDGDRLTVYSGRTEDLIDPLLDRFSEETGIGIDVRYGDSAELALLIEQEGDRSPADVVISQSPGALGFLGEADRLQALEPELLDLVGPDYRSGEGLWVGLSGRVRTLVYNTELLDPADLPASVFDLTDPAYEGDVGLAPENGSFQDFVTAMRQQEGDDVAREWLEAMEANDSPTYANNTAIVQAVARGEVPMGLVNHYYNERQLIEDPGSPTENHFFADGDLGSLLLATGAGVVEGSEQLDGAERLLRFLLEPESQRFFGEETFEYPLAQGVEAVVDPPLESLATAVLDFDALGGGLAATTELIDASGL